MGTWFFSLVRGLFVLIDKIVLWAVETLYGVLIDISTVRIFSSDVLSEFSSRIGTILSIFMLFKLSFSFLTYIINPDQMTDKSKGFAKIIQNIAVSLILLTTYQFLFDKAMDLQMAIINNNTIPKIILGTKSTNEATDSNSNALTYNLFVAFIRPNSTLEGVCDNYGKEVTQECINAANAYSGNLQNSNGYGYGKVDGREGGAGNQLADITLYNNTWALLDLMIPITSGDVFLFDYRFLLSTICCGVVAAVLLTFCIDVSIRMIKLGFLNLIAPVPIISYIDPNKGEGIFKKWLSTVGKVYLDLFIRLIAIWFAIYIIQLLGGNTITYREGQVLNDPFIVVFIIIGALMFAKQVPKLIQDITGFNFDSKMQLNPLKRIREEALGGKALVAGAAGLAGAGLTAGGNLLHRGVNFRKNMAANGGGFKGATKTTLGMLGSGIAGATSGFWNTTKNAHSSGKVTQGISKGIEKSNTNRTQREIGREEGATATGIMRAKVSDKLGLETKGQRMKREVENTKNIKKSMDSVDQFIESDIVKKHSLYNVASFEEAVRAKNKYEALQKTSVEEVRQNAVSSYNSKIENSKNALSSAKNELNESYSKYNLSSDSNIEQLASNGTISFTAYSEIKKAKDNFSQVQQEYNNLELQKDAYVNDAVNKHLEELDAASQDAFNTMKVAKEEYFEMAMAENENSVNRENSSAQIKATVDTVRRTIDKSNQYDDNTKDKFNSTSLDQMMKETKKLNNEAISIENSEEYIEAQANTTYAGIKEGSYNNYKDPRATK